MPRRRLSFSQLCATRVQKIQRLLAKNCFDHEMPYTYNSKRSARMFDGTGHQTLHLPPTMAQFSHLLILVWFLVCFAESLPHGSGKSIIYHRDDDDSYERNGPSRSTTKFFGLIALIVIPIAIVFICTQCRVHYPSRRHLHDVAAHETIDRHEMSSIELEVKKRQSEESQVREGYKQIWFSRFVEHGNLRHWSLGIGKTAYELRKYELRRDEEGTRLDGTKHTSESQNHQQLAAFTQLDELSDIPEDSSGMFAKYNYRVGEWKLDMARREANRVNTLTPTVASSEGKEYYVCLVGWTTRSDEEILQAAKTTMDGFGTYWRAFNNCQDWAISFANSIVDQKASDWPWFESNTKTKYQEMVKLQPSEAVLWMHEQGLGEAVSFAKRQAKPGSGLDGIATTTSNITHAVGTLTHAIPG